MESFNEEMERWHEQMYDYYDDKAHTEIGRKKAQESYIQKEWINCKDLIIDENQPFRLYNDEELADLAERIKQSGLLHPIVVRRTHDRKKYEVLSGRNRAKAVMLNGDIEITAFIRNVGDDEAKMIMLNANLGQREYLLPSEKAKAYAMEAELLNRNGKRPETFSKDCKSYDARQLMAEKHSESKSSISNYIRLSHLIPELLALVDERKLPILTGLELSYLNEDEQFMVFTIYVLNGIKLNTEQLSAFKALSKEKNVNKETLEEAFESNKTQKPEFIKLNRALFSEFSEFIDSAPSPEQFFLNLLDEKYPICEEEGDADETKT
jgi:ParB family chromosome partitioning protein